MEQQPAKLTNRTWWNWMEIRDLITSQDRMKLDGSHLVSKEDETFGCWTWSICHDWPAIGWDISTLTRSLGADEKEKKSNEFLAKWL